MTVRFGQKEEPIGMSYSERIELSNGYVNGEKENRRWFVWISRLDK
jgi:hypothetical protein